MRVHAHRHVPLFATGIRIAHGSGEGIFQGNDRVREVDLVFAEVGGRLVRIPLILRSAYCMHRCAPSQSGGRAPLGQLKFALSGPRDSRAKRRGRDNLEGARGAHLPAVHGLLQRIVRRCVQSDKSHGGLGIAAVSSIKK